MLLKIQRLRKGHVGARQIRMKDPVAEKPPEVRGQRDRDERRSENGPQRGRRDEGEESNRDRGESAEKETSV